MSPRKRAADVERAVMASLAASGPVSPRRAEGAAVSGGLNAREAREAIQRLLARGALAIDRDLRLHVKRR